MSEWKLQPVPFKFQLSDLTLFSVSIPLQVRSEQPLEQTAPNDKPVPPGDELIEGSQGFLIRGMHIASELPSISQIGDYLCYIPLQYRRCFIDLGLSFEDYQKTFSSKTRSTIKRKVRKYAQHCGGTVPWAVYKTPTELREFFRMAREVSRLTYQERLLDCGLPDSEEFIQRAESLAAEERVRAYLLFDDDRPISYLYCPVVNGVVIYSHLGYDPSYMKMSVGTVLQWMALEQLFSEGRFRYFDFTEGESPHKRLFATHEKWCANVILARRTWRNTTIIHGHELMNRASNRLGVVLDRLGLKAKIKRIMRTVR